MSRYRCTLSFVIFSLVFSLGAPLIGTTEVYTDADLEKMGIADQKAEERRLENQRQAKRVEEKVQEDKRQAWRVQERRLAEDREAKRYWERELEEKRIQNQAINRKLEADRVERARLDAARRR